MKALFASLLLACLFIRCANAYGPIGHEIVGEIADERLANTPTGAKIHDLLDGLSLEKAAVIPDEIKGWDKKGADDPNIFHYSARPKIDEQLRAFWTANQPTHDLNSPMPSHHWFHYTDVPIFPPQKYADGKAGRSQWDIVHMMRYCIAVLKGEEPEDNARKITKPIAVILLAHYVGDIHQPLHVGAEYFDANGQPADPDKSTAALEDQGGNTITLHHAATSPGKNGNTSKLHGFWDNNAVMLNLPNLPDSMPKEQRRVQMDQARDQLVARDAKDEPKDWQMPKDMPLSSYPEAWANEILPIAREAHTRLVFTGMRVKADEEPPLAMGTADEKPPVNGVSYDDWAAHVVADELHKAGWRLADLLQKALQ